MSGVLAHPVPGIIRELLITNLSLGTDGTLTNWPVFASFMPEDTNDLITVYQTESKLQGRVMYSGEATEFYGFQTMVRAESYKTGNDKAQDILDAYDSTVKETTVAMTTPTNTYMVQAITRSGGVLPLGLEAPEGRRFLFSINALVSLYKI